MAIKREKALAAEHSRFRMEEDALGTVEVPG